MKNLPWAIGALIIIIVGIFVFAKNSGNNNDTTIPQQADVKTPSPNVPNLDFSSQQGDDKKMQVPFPILKSEEISGKKVRLSTDKGDILFELDPDSPIAASNFVYLVNKKFYDGLIFHRVIKGFMIQGGDPQGVGTGGPGYAFPDEPVKKTYTRGRVAMANSGPNTNGSQFFIMHNDYALQPNYTIFGNVTSGIEAVDEIAESQTDQNDKPLTPISIKKATLE